TLAATYDWVGTSLTNGVYNWNNKLNWQVGGVAATAVPGAADIVRIAVNSYTNDPTITDAESCASIIFGVYDNFTLTVNGTLTVSGDITQNNDPNFYQYTTLAGTGTISCKNFYVGDNTMPNTGIGVVNNVSCQVAQMTINGNLVLNSVGNSTSDGIVYPYFSLDANKLTLYGQIKTTTYSNPLSEGVGDPNYPGLGLFQMDSGTAATTLELLNNAPILTPITTGFTVDFTNNGAGAGTVIYDATSGTQTVYTTGTSGLGINNYNYDYLTFGGASTKTLIGGALTIGSDWTTGGTGTVDLATNNPTITVSDNWVNSTNVTQGSGSITLTNILQNNSNTITLGSGGLTVGNILQINFGAVNCGSGTVTVNGVFQNNSGTFKCGSGSVILKSTYQNSGTFTAGTGTVYFSGASQILQDNSAAGTVFNKVTFNGSGTATMSAGVGNFAVSSSGVLTVTSPATLSAGSASAAYLTLKSDATGSATIAAMSGTASISGFVNVQRYITGGSITYRGYRLLSSPVNAGTVGTNKVFSLNYLKNSCYLTGSTGTTGGFDKTGNPTIYLYRENVTPTNSNFIAGNFRGINNVTAPPGYQLDGEIGTFNVPIGGGYLFYFRGNRSTSLASKTTSPYATPENTTLTATGNLNQGQVTVRDWYTPTSANLGYTVSAGNTAIRGFNLVGNPYASSINWDTYNTTSTTTGIYALSVSPTVYVLDPTTKNYGAYTKGSGGIGTHNATNVLVSGQGFFVLASNTSAKLIINESAKVNTQLTGANLLMSKSPLDAGNMQYLRLDMIKDSVNYDDILIRFNGSSTAAFSPDEDAEYKQGYGQENLASLSADSVPLAINVQPLPRKGAVIPLSVSAANDGNYTLSLKNIVGIPTLYSITLVDNYTHSSTDLRESPIYNFSISKSDSNSYGSNRFKLIFGQDPGYAYRLLNFAAEKLDNIARKQVELVWKTANEANYTTFTVERSTDNGATFQVIGSTLSSDLGIYSLIDNNPSDGLNLYRLKQENINDSITYSKLVPIAYAPLSNTLTGNINVYPNPVNSELNLTVTSTKNTGSYNIRITNSFGLVVKEANVSQPAWQGNVSNLLSGSYFIQVVNNKDQTLIGKAKFVKM
ncbi:MAG: T9SS type A sorting domain-containing protein, partial [Bacteroidetes bacterium]|nr:T9SS type A sorting domain-containing protein [Bacteroidota bacterium]